MVGVVGFGLGGSDSAGAGGVGGNTGTTGSVRSGGAAGTDGPDCFGGFLDTLCSGLEDRDLFDLASPPEFDLLATELSGPFPRSAPRAQRQQCTSPLHPISGQ